MPPPENPLLPLHVEVRIPPPPAGSRVAESSFPDARRSSEGAYSRPEPRVSNVDTRAEPTCSRPEPIGSRPEPIASKRPELKRSKRSATGAAGPDVSLGLPAPSAAAADSVDSVEIEISPMRWRRLCGVTYRIVS